MSYLVGYGAVAPLLLLLPFYLIDLFDLTNGAFKVGFGASVAVVVFRCIMGKHSSALVVCFVLVG